MKEELNVYTHRLQKCIDLVFPEFNSLFKYKYVTVYLCLLKTLSSADKIAHADIRSIRKCFGIQGSGKHITLTSEQLKETAKSSIGIASIADEIQIRHLIGQIELINAQLDEIDKERVTDVHKVIVSKSY